MIATSDVPKPTVYRLALRFRLDDVHYGLGSMFG